MKIIKFKINENYSEFEWAYKTAKRKTKNTTDTWKKRSNIQRFMDIYLGDLAKNLVAKHIKENLTLKKHLIEYDLIRKDNFKRPDKFDLKIKNLSIEVKSSAEKKLTNINDVFNQRRMIVNKNNIHEKTSDILIQVFFVSKKSFFQDVTNGKFNSLTLKDFTAQQFPKFLNETQIIISGYFLNDDIKKENKLFEVKGLKDNSKKRDYLNLFVRDSRNINSLNEYLLEKIVPKNKYNL